MSRMIHIRLLATAVTVLLFGTSGGAYAQPTGPSCEVERARLFKLNQQEFDQDMVGGWRALSARPGCVLAAADLIRDYRKVHSLEESILYWHEGQLRASGGQTEQSAVLLARSREPKGDASGWNEYVDATLAFLRKDRATFDDAWHRLAAIPAPGVMKDGYFDAQMADGTAMKIRWPINIDVVEGLAQCFDKPYRLAYGTDCRAPSK